MNKHYECPAHDPRTAPLIFDWDEEAGEMSGYALIDRPVGPFSPREELVEWVETCLRESEMDTDNKQWSEELAYAERLLKIVPDESVKYNGSKPSSAVDMPPNIPDLEIEYPVITSGSCATQEGQEWFDEHQKGKPPILED